MSQYLQYAFRSIARQPGLALATVLTLTLGLGLNVGVFTVIDGLLFRARVERDPASFVHLSPEYRYDHPARDTAWSISVKDYRAFAAGARTLSDLAAWNTARVTVGREENSILGMLVTGNFFRVYGQVLPVEGRLFTDDECSPGNGRHVVIVHGAPVDLTLTEFRIVHSLARRPGWVFTRYQIVESTRGEDSEVTDRSVDVHIVSLRKKLGHAGALVETVRGLGYRFKEMA